ncbi:MAG: hypothetical protein B7Z26_04850 [Asticcacaulis sp. 32-58-5]|nr:MAG: hypothetical protein B7Z26_04850 [Asticcacaulis sp. 32-58-5]
MRFQWNETKRQAVIKERQVDILYAALIFEGDVLTRVDDRKDYGEERLISMGMVDEEVFVVVYTLRDDEIRLITAWKGGRLEQEQYQTGILKRHQTDEGKG